MQKFGEFVVRFRIPIIIIAIILLIPSAIGMINTRVNYDMLTYLPSEIDTVKGQNILMDDFGKGAFSFIIVDGMEDKDVSALKKKVEAVDHVDSVIWYDSIMDISVPKELLPDKIYDAFNSGDSTIMAVFFNTSTSEDDTLAAIHEIRSVTNEKCFVTGMSALVTDLKDLCEREEPIYVGLAVILAVCAMMLFLDSWIIPFVFLSSIAMAILYNLGTNLFLGEISYITKALSAVLQLAVTMDYSIFLWNSYNEEKKKCTDNKSAMSNAIAATLTSVLGSSVTTVAGFIALCFMSYTLGADLGIVMAKGVVFGVIGCVTTLPSLILLLDKPLENSRHRSLIPRMDRLSGFVTKHSWIFAVLFVALLVPSLYGYNQTNKKLYYNIADSLPQDLDYMIANSKLDDEFKVGSTHMVLCRSSLDQKSTKQMLSEFDKVDGVKYSLGLDSVVGSLVPEEIIPDSVKEVLQSDKYKLILINSEYQVASDEVNCQIDSLNSVLKKYDENGMLIGEAPCTKDLVEITDNDFRVVNTVSIVAIFIIILLVTKSVTLPVILVAVIELAIFINLGIPFYTGSSLSFITPICISTIQLGATVDYAILMTTRYKRERSSGCDKHEAVKTALTTSIPSIIVSAMGLFAATFGVAVYSEIDIISSMCMLMARGAVISMFAVIFILPSMLMLFDKVIIHTSLGFKNKPEIKISEKKPEEIKL